MDASLLKGTESEFDEALHTYDLPLAVWEIPSGTIILVTEALGRLAGLRANELIGHRIQEFAEPRQKRVLNSIITAFDSGAVDAVRTRGRIAGGRISDPRGGVGDVWIWSRSAGIGGRRGGISFIVVEAEQSRVRRNSWGDLTRVAVGIATHDGQIESVCADMAVVTGFPPSALMGRPLSDVLVFQSGGVPRSFAGWIDVPARVVVHRADGSSIPGGFLYAVLRDDRERRAVFAVLVPDQPHDTNEQRLHELEMHLRRIASEVRAAGMLDQIGVLPSMVAMPTLSELSGRQWEILSGLLRGERVPTIARRMYLSQSTVRNHLSAIFRKFGVHSQPELIERLRTEENTR
jgi:DNA-binding CsgD family transcriptional regulator/PAS domain-containing protein